MQLGTREVHIRSNSTDTMKIAQCGHQASDFVIVFLKPHLSFCISKIEADFDFQLTGVIIADGFQSVDNATQANVN